MFLKISEKCVKKFYLAPAKFISVPGLAWQAALIKTVVKLELSTNIDVLLMVQKGIRRGIYHAIHQYTKANKKYMKDSDKNKKSSYLK